MTERTLLVMQAAKYHPEDKKLAANSLDNMGVKEIREYLRKCNYARNRGELNEQFREWIIGQEKNFTGKIANIYKVGEHKVKLAYYGMVFTILDYAGCYLMGKSSSPIGITHSRYCAELKLEDRLNSGNVRKAIANDFYGHNYVLSIAELANGEERCIDPTIKRLEPIFTEIAHEINLLFIN